jgi:hypothetical protein
LKATIAEPHFRRNGSLGLSSGGVDPDISTSCRRGSGLRRVHADARPRRDELHRGRLCGPLERIRLVRAERFSCQALPRRRPPVGHRPLSPFVVGPRQSSGTWWPRNKMRSEGSPDAPAWRRVFDRSLRVFSRSADAIWQALASRDKGSPIRPSTLLRRLESHRASRPLAQRSVSARRRFHSLLHRGGCGCRVTCDSASFALRSPAATRTMPQIATTTPIPR